MSGKKLASGRSCGIDYFSGNSSVVVFVVLLQSGERRIAVQYSKKYREEKHTADSQHIPLRVNTAGVIPVIFASSLMQTPIVIAQFLGKGNGTGIGSQILAAMNSNNWCNPAKPVYTVGLVCIYSAYNILCIFLYIDYI